MSEIFDELYSQYYDLLYKNKNYSLESRYVLNSLQGNSETKINSILELGCGTGGHALHWLDQVERWTGVDLSSEMLSKCRENLAKYHDKITLKEANISKLKLNQKYDAVVSLFHVASYQSSNEQLDDFFKVASEHLEVGGVFAFDFWSGPAVLTDRPYNKLLEVGNDSVKITRFTEPKILFNENVVEVKFKVWIDSLESGAREELLESHRMRYFFIPELLYFSSKHGLKIKSLSKWMSNDHLDEKSWYGFAVMSK